jgi:hypothetical protein
MSDDALPSFFIPHATAENQEGVYTEFAKMCNREPRPLGERIYSIDFTHDGVECTATVGEQLRGTRTMTTRGRERTTQLSDPATILAIFPGDPYLVVTDAAPLGKVQSKWVNPFLAGRPKRVVRFRAP